jgi:sortase A
VRVTYTVLNVMSLLLVGVGLVLTATFFVDAPLPGLASAGEIPSVGKGESEAPALADRKGPEKLASGKKQEEEATAGEEQGEWKKKREAVKVPEDKTLKLTIPEMARIRNDTVPYAGGTDENAFRNNAGVHVRGTGFPWQRQANVFIAGHRLGYVGTPSFLAFWDLNKLETGDKIFVTDSRGRRYVYGVLKDFVVDPKDVFVLRPLRGKNILTLQTCTLPDYSRRLIVQAERVA